MRIEKASRKPPSGEWVGFFDDSRHPGKKGWMQTYMDFDEQGNIRGEGTDWVGAWQIVGTFDLSKNHFEWTKKYINMHEVSYRGQFGEQGLIGEWSMEFIADKFHIWPRSYSHLQELYLREEEQMRGSNGRRADSGDWS